VEIVAILVLIVVALSGADYAYYWYSPAPLAPHLSTAVQRSTMRLGERERTYLAYVPANLPPKSALVIVLHGSGMDGKRMRECTGYEFDRLADQRGFAVLYPDGYRFMLARVIRLEADVKHSLATPKTVNEALAELESKVGKEGRRKFEKFLREVGELDDEDDDVIDVESK
jgi:poly(3-hydroxybutyrate) depolymerase